ncbi:MAG: TylF/MycF family methyltransferase [Raineya sp.]|jgi:hypothetical protein|nr:TylF/MycF family methyltransferase [Raineya sp.]
MKKLILKLIDNLGYKLEKKPHPSLLIENELAFDKEFMEIYNLCKPYTMTSLARMYALYQSVKYVVQNNIEGDFVECGVWKGGSSMLIARYLQIHQVRNKKVYLYDTFEGMSAPTEKDVDIKGDTAQSSLSKQDKEDDKSIWCYSALEEVQNNLAKTQFSQENLVFVKGKVEDTIPETIPSKIALLRLDTDWYESTLHELQYLYPLLENKGPLIIDDYGHWQGCRKAVDEYFAEKKIHPLLQRIDYTGRMMIKF